MISGRGGSFCNPNFPALMHCGRLNNFPAISHLIPHFHTFSCASSCSPSGSAPLAAKILNYKSPIRHRPAEILSLNFTAGCGIRPPTAPPCPALSFPPPARAPSATHPVYPPHFPPLSHTCCHLLSHLPIAPIIYPILPRCQHPFPPSPLFPSPSQRTCWRTARASHSPSSL